MSAKLGNNNKARKAPSVIVRRVQWDKFLLHVSNLVISTRTMLRQYTSMKTLLLKCANFQIHDGHWQNQKLFKVLGSGTAKYL